MRIDAHHHFWRYSPEEYGWIDDAMAAIQRDFLPPDLAAEIRSAGIDAVVSVQARQSLDETNFLLDHAAAHPWIAGVVGWLPLTDTRMGAVLDEYSARPQLKGVREILQAEPAAYFILRTNVLCVGPTNRSFYLIHSNFFTLRLECNV